MSVASLERLAVLSGGAPTLAHPDGAHVVSSSGSSVVVRCLATGGCSFLQAHSAAVSCIALSPCGGWLASGQHAAPGVKEAIAVWSWPSVLAALAAPPAGADGAAPVRRLSFHRGGLQALAFSPDGRLLASLGGESDGLLAVWQVAEQRVVCSAPAASHAAITAVWLRSSKNGARLLRAQRYCAPARCTCARAPRLFSPSSLSPSRPPSLLARRRQSCSPRASFTCAAGAWTWPAGA